LALLLSVLCFASFSVRAQGADRWVTLAKQAVNAKAGRASIDLSKARGSFRAVRVRVQTGALALTLIELRYHGGIVHRAHRAAVLRHNQGPRLIDSRSEDHFVDSLVLGFRPVPGETDRAILLVEGLQSPSGAVAVRGQPGRSVAETHKPKE